MILTRVVVMRLAAIMLSKKIKNAQFVAMLVVGMVVVRIKMRYQRRNLRQLSHERGHALREQNQGKEYGDAIFHKG